MKKTILIFGAGKSSTFLIEYLIKECATNDWQLVVCDADATLAESKIKNAAAAKAVSINAEDDAERKKLVQSADIVISMLPPALHFLIAKDCVEFNKNLLTASYVDENIKSLEKQIADKKLLFLCEMGLDPGIDHMSAMKMITSIKNKGATIESFISHCGGLISPESDTNPWHYKITWNSKNIILAGKDGARYLKDKKVTDVPYRFIFRNCPSINIPGIGEYAWYPNRDSFSYIATYHLEEASTFIRTTLRHPAFCRGWNRIINLGFTATDDYEKIKNCKTYHDWYQVKISPYLSNNKDWNNYLHLFIMDPYKNEYNKQTNFLGLHDTTALPQNFNCSADIMQYLFEKKLAMKADDKDMVIMHHEIEYANGEKKNQLSSSLVLKGEDSVRTAMAKTVGLPLGIATKLILQKKITLTGLHIPILPEIYEPVLSELEMHGIVFKEMQLTQ